MCSIKVVLSWDSVFSHIIDKKERVIMDDDLLLDTKIARPTKSWS